MNTIMNNGLQVQIMILLNKQSEYWVKSLLARLQIDWSKCIEVLINSYKNYYNGLGINKGAWFNNNRSWKY